MSYILTQDDDGHWYVVPADKQEEFSSWVENFSDEEDYPSLPDWAVEVGGSPSLVQFPSFEIT